MTAQTQCTIKSAFCNHGYENLRDPKEKSARSDIPQPDLRALPDTYFSPFAAIYAMRPSYQRRKAGGK